MNIEHEELLFVRAGGRDFAVATRSVREVLPLVAPRPVPGWPEAVVGVIDVRGAVVALVDLAASLGLGTSPLRPHQLILHLQHAGGGRGLLVDEVLGLREVDVHPALGFSPPLVPEHEKRCRGVVLEREGATVVLDAAALLSAVGADGLEVRIPAGPGEPAR